MRTFVVSSALLAAAVALWAGDSAAGIHWNAPSHWKAQPERPMRAATYSVAAAAGDREDGECGVYYFGMGGGGSVKANVDRWVGQFTEPDGSPLKGATMTKLTIHGLIVTTIDVSGTYSGAGGPMAKTKVLKPGYRMLAAIVEAPQGNVFFKFTGPAKTVAANAAAFHAMIDSVSK